MDGAYRMAVMRGSIYVERGDARADYTIQARGLRKTPRGRDTTAYDACGRDGHPIVGLAGKR